MLFQSPDLSLIPFILCTRVRFPFHCLYSISRSTCRCFLVTLISDDVKDLSGNILAIHSYDFVVNLLICYKYLSIYYWPLWFKILLRWVKEVHGSVRILNRAIWVWECNLYFDHVTLKFGHITFLFELRKEIVDKYKIFIQEIESMLNNDELSLFLKMLKLVVFLSKLQEVLKSLIQKKHFTLTNYLTCTVSCWKGRQWLITAQNNSCETSTFHAI